MRDLVYFVAVSLDGYIAGPQGDISAFPTRGDHIDALVEEFPETLPAPFWAQRGQAAAPQHFDAVVMGSHTYDVGVRVGLVDPYPQLQTWVFSRTRSSPNERVQFIQQDPGEFIQKLKETGGRDVWLCGGGDLAGQLHAHIDRLILKVNPMVLGQGVKLFGEARAETSHFELVSSRRFDTGVVFNGYRRRG